jgi:hypothetical protein
MDRLKKQRGAIKAKFTRLDNFFTAHPDPEHLDKSTLQVRMELLETARREYEENHRDIIDAVNDAGIDAEEKEMEDVELRYITLKSHIQSIVDKDDDEQASNGSAVTGPHRNQQNIAKVKLPQLDLPKFSGDVLMWTSFRDLFTSMVHNQAISDSQKLQYLKTSLTGEAAALIQSIDVTDANYQEAWRILGDQYQNERYLIHSHLQSLFGQSHLKEESASGLRNVLDHTTKCVRALHVLGLPTDEWDAFLVFTIVDRIDSDSRRQWELHSPGSSYLTLESIKKFIEQRCRALEATTTKCKVINRPHTARTTVNAHHSSSYGTCQVCNESHFINQCETFGDMDVKCKQSIVKEKNLCFNCLRANHSVRNCSSKSSCRKCGKKHHTLLHNEDSEPAKQSGTQQPSSSKEEVTHSDPKFSGHSSNSLWCPVILSTAVVNVEDCTGRQNPCRVLIDGGSQASFMTESCVRRLGLKRSRSTTSILGIGHSGAQQVKGKVNFTLHSCHNKYSVSIEALILKQITGLIPNSKVSLPDLSYLQHLQLADPNFNHPGEIDILLGAELSDKIIMEGRVAGPCGLPSARNSELGWIVSGRVSNESGQQLISNVSTLGIDNPSDMPSRGIAPQQLVDSQLWWNGTTWLSGSPNLWPSAVLQSSTEAEVELRPVKTIAFHSIFESNFLEKYSKFSRLIRTTA